MVTNNYIPINVDFSVKRQCDYNTLKGKLCKLIMHLQKKLRLRIYSDLSCENQINDQLMMRKKFPKYKWEELFSNTREIEKVLKDISEIVGRVNHNYIPEDLLIYALWDDTENDTAEWFMLAIRDIFGYRFSVSEIVEKANSNITLKDFFSLLNERIAE